MKLKIYPFLFVAFLLTFCQSKAQTVTCNSGFSYQVNGNMVSFVPVDTLANNSHLWSFGDGNTSFFTAPIHTYSSGGTYVVKHVVRKYNPNGVVLCADSTIQTVLIQSFCNLQANFTYTRDSLNRKKYYFTNTTVNFTPTDSIRWNFGDGSAFNYTPNPTHTYANYGTYNVCIRVKRNTASGTTPCVSELCKIVVVDSVMPPICNAAFTYIIQGQTVSFVSAMPANNTTQHQWSFGNGGTSNLANPIYTYPTAGTYTVVHNVFTIGANGITQSCTDTSTLTIASPCNLQANFTYTRDSLNRKKYYFTNTTVNFTPTDSIRWNFGDGSAFNYTPNPTHTYANYGTYNVCIRVKRNTASGTTPCVSELCKIVVVDSVPVVNCSAAFTYNMQGLTVAFVSAMPTATNVLHQWQFGNGGSSTLANPLYTYSTGGAYTVKHKVTIVGLNGAVLCTDSATQTITLTTANCNLQAHYTFVKDSSNRRKLYFTNTTVNILPTDSVRWIFGDGSPFVYTTNATHTYNNYGTYIVCLRVKRSTATGTTPCVSEYCQTIIVDSVASNTCSYNVDFTMQRDTVQLFKVYFTNTSTPLPGATATWYFGDGASATGWNAVHTYNYAGPYQPCLVVRYSNTCSKVKCKVLQLPISTACTLQPYPNPASNVVNATVQLTQPMVIYTRVYNSSNIIVRQQQQNGTVGFNTISVNVATLPLGIYRLVIRYGNKECKGTFLKN